MVRERNEARAQLRWEQGSSRQLTRQRDDAQEAAEEYWEAWQESASFCDLLADLNEEWRKKVENIDREAAAIRDSGQWWIRQARQNNEETIRLRAVLEKYGQHLEGCDEWPTGCTCGLISALGETKD